MNVEQIIKDFPKALLNWYSFKKGLKALYISGAIPELEVLFGMLQEHGLKVAGTDTEAVMRITDRYDYVILAGSLEKSENPTELLGHLKTLLSEKGKLFALADNRLAIRYFCGDKDRFTGHVLDGIDNYQKVNEKRMKEIGARAYSKAELSHMFEEAGFKKYKFYSVMPELIRPHMMIADGYTPNELLDIRIFPFHHSPETIFLEEENLYGTLLENHMFHQMANGFLVECTAGGELSDADEITVQEDRSASQAMATILKKGTTVSKKALYKEGQKKIAFLMDNVKYLSEHQVPVVEAWTEGECFVSPYVEGQLATEYFRELLRKDREKFIAELQHFRNIIEHSSEAVPYDKVNWKQFEPGWKERKADDPNIDKWQKLAYGSLEDKKQIGTILKRGYIDLVSLNCFHTSKGFQFFDQEFYIEDFPVNAVFMRTVDMIYNNNMEMEQLYQKDELLRKLLLYEHKDTWRRMADEFLTELRNEKELASYHSSTRRDWSSLASNRHRMDYSQAEYDKLFKNIFKDVENKKIYLFGSGIYAEDFIKKFADCYEIAGILDNNRNRWGETMSGITIYGPERLKQEEGPYKVFICIKHYEDVLNQLRNMGVKNMSVYELRLEYERPLKYEVQKTDGAPKKYHVGYVAGVFDLFHIGHLNLFRSAKEQCDYLIVGVVSDEQVINDKKTSPYIPFEERLAIVQACRYVDEAVPIPVNEPDTEAAYRKYHFDVQFSGSDYADDPIWKAKRTFLKQRGSELVFFPYTESTSSSKLKSTLQEKVQPQ